MTYKKKLIEVALPLEDINREAAREKSIRHGHPSTLHLWWARRPLAACRAVLFASLVDDPSECVKDLLADPDKRRGAEKELKACKKAWAELKVIFTKASGAGMKSVPDPGAEPKLEDVIVEVERERLFNIIRELVKWENSNDERVLNAARTEIMRSCNGQPPPVYDPFCGGGSIPLEAQRLGLEAHASDLNPVPVLINKALIEIPPKFAGQPPVNPESRKKLSASGSWKGAAGLAEDVRYYGQWMRDEAEKRIGHLYPPVCVVQEKDGSWRHATAGERQEWEADQQKAKADPDFRRNSKVQCLTVIAWLWARTVASPNPAAKGAHLPLVRSFWLSTKVGKKAWVEPVVEQSTMTYRFEVRTGEGEPRTSTVGRNGGVCLLTGSPMPLEYVRAEAKAGRLGTRLMAIVAEGRGARIFLPPNEDHDRIARSAEPHDVPDTHLPKEALGFRVQNYGMTKHSHLFTNRQLVALTTFCDLVGEARARAMKDSGEQAYADAVATYLGFAIGKSGDYWTALASWQPDAKNLRVGHLFTRQAVAMCWDFGESNPLGETTANFPDTVAYISRVVERLPAEGSSMVQQLNAEALASDTLRVFSTDPPYYDNVPYADLSDFFYVWLRRCLQPVYPQ